MPDVGVPAPPPIATDPTRRSHTASAQWQSFEMRMRQRRAERCRLRAEVAIEAGFPDDARAALEEARRLSPFLPGLEETEQKAALATARAAELPAGRRGRRLATGALAAGLTIAGFLMYDSGNGPAVVSSSPAAVAAAPRFVPTSGTSADLSDAAARDGLGAPDPTPDAPAEPRRDDAFEIRLDPVGPLATSAPARETPPPVTVAVADLSPPAEPPAVLPPPDALPPPNTTLPDGPPDVPARENRTETRADAPASAAAEAEVRTALSRYEAAYSALNAAAARAIFPGVDVGALARAFESLESQRVSLGACDVTVETSGQTARAQCAGHATWSPRIGGGEHRAERRWTFELERSPDGWRIVSATTR